MHNFSWFFEDKLAASALPYLDEPEFAGQSGASGDLDFLLGEEIGAVLSLEAVNSAILKKAGIEHLHIKVKDFTAPSLDQLGEAVAFIDEQLTAGRKVLVHCHAGYGRTGTILAAWLVHRGMDPKEAIREVRRKRPFSIETGEQEDAIYQYAETL